MGSGLAQTYRWYTHRDLIMSNVAVSRIYLKAMRGRAKTLRAKSARKSVLFCGSFGVSTRPHVAFGTFSFICRQMDHDPELMKFATRYAEAWCSQGPEKVAAF